MMKIFQLLHRLLTRIEGKLKKIGVVNKFERYKNMMGANHPFKNFHMKITGDMSANPHEFFSHYDSYSV